MRVRIVAAVAVVALLGGGLAASAALPSAIASLGSVRVAPLHAGDELRFESADPRDGATARTWLVRVEGEGVARDRFGDERPVDLFTVETRDAEGDALAWRCAALRGGEQGVRADAIDAGLGTYTVSYTRGTVTFSERRGESELRVVSSFDETCPARSPAAGRSFSPGDAVRAADALEARWGVGPDAEAVAQEAAFEGRDAVRLAYSADASRFVEDAPEGARATVEVVLADGLPAPASVRVATEPDGEVLLWRLSGHRAGSGPALAPVSGARLPETNPDGLARTEPWRLDDVAFGLAYPFDEAVAAMRADPSTGLAGFLDAHPRAVLTYAYYDAHGTMPPFPASSTDGSWLMAWTGGGERLAAATARFVPGEGPVGAPQKVVVSRGRDVFDDLEGRAPADAPPAPGPRASSATLLSLARGEGYQGPAAWLSYSLDPDGRGGAHARLAVAEIDVYGSGPEGERDGAYVSFDAGAGALERVYDGTTRTTRSGVLQPLPDGTGLAEDRSALGVLAGPLPGEGLAVGLGGLALALLALKLVLLPLYTRLRRDRLLDNPTRARLYEQVRREPGVHQAELVDFAGVGKGAAVRHLDQLRRHGYVLELRVDGMTRYYAAGEVPPALAREAALLRGASARRVYDLLSVEPGLTLREAAGRLGMSAPSVHRQKKRLEKAGLLPAARAASVSTR